jgi:hypothetical protein
MENPEICDIGEEMLFRKYEEKIKCAKGIAEIMLKYETNEIREKKTGNESNNAYKLFDIDWLNNKIIKKLQSSLIKLEKQ